MAVPEKVIGHPVPPSAVRGRPGWCHRDRRRCTVTVGGTVVALTSQSRPPPRRSDWPAVSTAVAQPRPLALVRQRRPRATTWRWSRRRRREGPGTCCTPTLSSVVLEIRPVATEPERDRVHAVVVARRAGHPERESRPAGSRRSADAGGRRLIVEAERLDLLQSPWRGRAAVGGERLGPDPHLRLPVSVSGSDHGVVVAPGDAEVRDDRVGCHPRW